VSLEIPKEACGRQQKVFPEHSDAQEESITHEIWSNESWSWSELEYSSSSLRLPHSQYISLSYGLERYLSILSYNSTRNLAYSSFKWNSCQTLFEQSKSDTLLLLDCCSAAAAAAAVPCRTNSITEIIAACGWETWAPEPGRHSFTNTLIEVLEDWVDHKSFSAAMLHCEVLSVLKQPWRRKNREISKTPVYIVSTSNPKSCSIELGRRSPLTHVARKTIQGIDSASSSSCQPQLSSSMVTNAASSQGGVSLSNADNDDKFDLSSLLATLPDKTFILPHVIVSVAWETDQTLDLDGFQQWMRLFPALAKYSKIEGVYHSHSTLVLLSVPVVVWNMLPEDPACNFVGYARSTNLLKPEAPPQITKHPPFIQSTSQCSKNDQPDEWKHGYDQFQNDSCKVPSSLLEYIDIVD
jgi:hypothetical protein